jgi:hypothetical protein
LKRQVIAIALTILITLSSLPVVFSDTIEKELPNELLKKYEKFHIKQHENTDHYHIYYPKYDGEVGIYHVGRKKELIWIWAKDYGSDVRDIKCKYLGKGVGEAKVYLKNGEVVEEKNLFVDVSGKNSYTFYLEGKRLKEIENKISKLL